MCRCHRSATVVAALVAASCLVRAPAAERCEPVIWRTDVGGPRKGVSSFAQSPDGFLWLLNTETLSRFDGKEFQSLTLSELPERKVPAQMWSDGRGFRIADREGAVWDWKDGTFTLLFPPQAGGVRPVAAWRLPDDSTMVLARDGRRWQCRPGEPARELSVAPRPVPGTVVWTPGGEAWWLSDGQELIRCSGDETVGIPLPPDAGTVRTIAAAAPTAVWVGTSRTLLRWTGSALEAVPPPSGQHEWQVKWMDAGGGDHTWMEANGSLWVLRSGAWAAIPAKWPEDAPPILTSVDLSGNLWYGDKHGHVTAVQPDGVNVFLEDIGKLNGGPVESLFCDREGNTWAGIARVGLVQFKRQRFRSLTPANGLPAPMVWIVCEDGSGALWCAGEAHFVGRWKDGMLSVLDVDSGTLPAQAGALWPDAGGRMLAGLANEGLYREDAGLFAVEQPYFRQPFRGVFHFVYEDRAGRRWLGLGSGLLLFDGKSSRLLGERDGLLNTAMRSVAEDASGRVWVGSASGGAAWYDDESGRFHSLTPADGLPHRSVYALCGAADGSLWIGTVGGGLARWRNGKITVCTTAHGLPDNRIMQIIEDGAGSLWVGTRAGLARISLASLDAFERGETKTLDLVTFDRCDGLPTREFSGGKQPAVFKARDGALWFATTGGLASCDPSSLTLNRVPPRPQILAAFLDGYPAENPSAQPGPYGTLEFRVDPLEIPPGPHSLEFRWTAPCLISGEKMRYSYRLEGVENEWSPASEQTAAAYGTLPPGSYRLLVRACNHDGTWSETPAVLAMVVHPYWWQRTGVRIAGVLLGALLLSLTVLGIVRARHRRHLARAELRRARETERTRIARDLHDDLGSSLTEISMLATTLPGAASEPGMMREKLTAISGKARSLVEALDEIVWAVNPRHDTADSLATYLTGYAREFLAHSNIVCSFDVPSPLPDLQLDAEPRHSLFLALKEILNNIVRHSQATNVKLTLRADDESLTISVEDNGRGLHAGQGENGDGLRNMQERLQSAGGECVVESTAGAGTCVRLRLPITAATALS